LTCFIDFGVRGSYCLIQHLLIEAYCRKVYGRGHGKKPGQVYRILLQRAKGYTYDKIGKRHGLTRDRIRQIIIRASWKMNKHLFIHGLRKVEEID